MVERLHDLTGELMTWHMREPDHLMSSPRVPVTAAHPGGDDPDHHPARRGHGLRNLPNLRPTPNDIDHHGAHHHIVAA